MGACMPGQTRGVHVDAGVSSCIGELVPLSTRCIDGCMDGWMDTDEYSYAWMDP